MNVSLLLAEATDLWSSLGSTQLTNIIYLANFVVLFLTLGIVALSVGVATIVWRTTSQHNADEHVHRLFSEYLKIRSTQISSDGVQHEGQNYVTRLNVAPTEDGHVYDMTGMKLYILEEMYSWVLLREKAIKYTSLILSAEEKIIAIDNLKSWHRTIITHALEDFDNTRKSIIEFATCYSVKFIVYIAKESQCNKLLSLASDHSRALENGTKRPLGTEEVWLAARVANQSRGA